MGIGGFEAKAIFPAHVGNAISAPGIFSLSCAKQRSRGYVGAESDSKVAPLKPVYFTWDASVSRHFGKQQAPRGEIPQGEIRIAAVIQVVEADRRQLRKLAKSPAFIAAKARSGKKTLVARNAVATFRFAYIPLPVGEKDWWKKGEGEIVSIDVTPRQERHYW
jgi:hypothetical protein